MDQTRPEGRRAGAQGQSDAEWRAELTPAEFHVTRQAGTERPGTGPWLHEKRAGTYLCVACGQPLFRSETEFGSGWPSFFQPMATSAVERAHRQFHVMASTEVRCAACDAHLGHVFPDGPRPTGLRYCMNGTALQLYTDEQRLRDDVLTAPAARRRRPRFRREAAGDREIHSGTPGSTITPGSAPTIGSR